MMSWLGWARTAAPRALGLAALLTLACRPTAQTPSISAVDPSAPPPAAPAPATPLNVSSVSSVRPADPPLSPPVTVRVAVVGSASDAGILLGMELGYFREQGIQIELSSMQSAQQMVPLLGTGQLDVGGGATSAGLINAVGLDVPIRLVA